MADYSWVDLQFESRDPEIVQGVERLLGSGCMVDNAGAEWTNVGAETAFGLADEAEAFLQEKGIAYYRSSDGKYEYDGDEALWQPGMEQPRTFTRLNNGGRVFTQDDLRAFVPEVLEHADAELGAFVREFFAFDLSAAQAEPCST